MMNCKTCHWWKDYSDRVYASVPGVRGQITSDGLIELRRCRFKPQPGTARYDGDVYTSEDNGCGCWKRSDAHRDCKCG